MKDEADAAGLRRLPDVPPGVAPGVIAETDHARVGTFDTRDLPESLQQLGLPPEINVELTMPERMMLDREILRAQLRELRIRIREAERRRHRYRRYYPH